MKLLIMLVLLIPILMFQLFILSDSISLLIKTKKNTSRANNIYFRNERSPRETSFRVVK